MAALICEAVLSDGYSAYLGTDQNDGDNSNWGHHILRATREKWELVNPEGNVIWERSTE